ncbi:unnamed protein product [Closterium sp. NIES-64]|nr:unnamed protein product [Closterium sp. NIES-64]
MAAPSVLTFDAEGRAVDFEVWVDDLQLFLQCDRAHGLSLFDLTSSASPTPPATANSTVRSQWATRDAVARLAVRRHLPTAERAHFSQHKSAQTLYDAVVTRYSSPATAALSRLMLPYLFPDLAAFPTVTDLITHLRTSDTRYCAALPADRSALRFPLAGDAAPARARGARALEVLAGAVEVAVEAVEGVGVVVGVVAEVEVSMASVEAEEAAAVAVGAEAAEVAAAAAAAVELVAALHREVDPVVVRASCSSAVVRPPPPSSFVSGPRTYVLRTGDRAGEQCGGPHSTQRCFGRLTDAWRHQFPDATEIPRWGELSRAGVAIFNLDYDAILAAMYAVSSSDEGDCYLCVPPDPGIEAAALGAGEAAALGASASTTPGAGESELSSTTSAQALHTFTLDSGASRSFFQDRTTLTLHSRPVAVSLADPSGGPVLAHFSTVLPCPAAPSGTLSSLYLHSFSTNLTLLWHHRLGHPSLPRLRGMASRVLVSGLPRSLPPLPPRPAPTCVPCVEGRQPGAPHSSEFPLTEAPLQTLHMVVWGPAHVCGQGHKRYFLLVVHDYSRDTTVFPLRSKGDVTHQLNLQPRVSLPETSPTLRWTGKVGDASAFRVWGSRAFVRDLSADKLSPRAVPCVFLGFPPDAPGWQFYHSTSRRVLSSQDVTFDESVPYYRLFPYRTAPLPAPPLFLAPDAVEPVEVAVDSSAARGAEPAGAEFGGAEPGGLEPRGAESRGAELGGAESRGAEPGGVEPGGAEPWGATRVVCPPLEPCCLSWRRTVAAGPGGARTDSTRAAGKGVAAGAAGSGLARGTAGAAGGTGADGPAGAGAAAATGARAAAATGAGAARGVGPGGATGASAAGAAGVGVARGVGAGGAASAGASEGAGVGAVGARGTAGAGAAAGGTGAVPASSGGAARPRPYFVPLLEQPASPLLAPSPYTSPTGGLAERRQHASRPASPVRADRTSSHAPRPRPPAVPSTHQMALRPSTAPLRVPLPSPPESSLPVLADPESDSLRAANPTVTRLLATFFTNPSFVSTAACALVAELVDFAARCRLDYATSLVAESEYVCPPSVGGESALRTDVLEDRQKELQCFVATLPHLVSTLIAPEGDPYAPDIPTPRSYAEAIEGPYSSQWQSAMDTEMASWKSTGTYVDKVPPPGANIVSGMWIFRVKRPPGSLPVFKARYVARGFSQRQGVDYFQTFSPTLKMTTLRVLLHIAAQRDYELHSLDFSTAFLQGSLHEEI